MKTEYLSIRIKPMLKDVLQRRADTKQHSLTETVTEILIDRLLKEGMIIRFNRIIEKLMKEERK